MSATTQPTSLDEASLHTRRAIARWLLAVCALIVAMVAVGGITRLTESGLSIVDWKPVTGALPPLDDAAWQAEFARYQQFPQFRVQFRGALTLEQFKRLFFWEWFHRLLGRTIGMAYALPMAWYWRRAGAVPGLRAKLLVGLALGGAQGLLGWFMVKSGLVHMPRVSHYRLCAHLLTAFASLAWVEWTALDLLADPRAPRGAAAPGLRLAAKAFAVVLVVQIAWGAFTAGLRAGYGYPTWPTMNGAWVPSHLWVTTPAWRSVFEHTTAVHFVHRWLGAAVGLFALALALAGPSRSDDARVRAWLRGVGAVAAVQFALGVVTVLTSVHLHVAVTHQTVGCLLLATAVALLHALRGAR